ncbi:MAG TPA: hypothetical protein VM492_08575 [Sumerlaeia bacterium]|nr:hypothetical protein [Sumerlaeia bacterium]
MKGRILISLFAVLVGVLLDAVAGPTLLGGRTGLHFAAAAVVLVGMRSGVIWGLGAGWLAATALVSLHGGPLGMSMLTLGLAGACAGLFAKAAALELVWLDALILLGVLLAEDALAGLLAWGVYGVAFRLEVGGIVAATLVSLLARSLASHLRRAIFPAGSPESSTQRRGVHEA